ncbi:hypothetical protein [Leptolyngbya sp. PCC 6406]|uniref:hypothetical protein n=1 Tax=Leptolyngbya sp. PCC 6406 TaxID=1173264 RepID=UPI0002DBC0B7|nr:hypothetical protein [Leptolyngbya sp. PCC 6406]
MVKLHQGVVQQDLAELPATLQRDLSRYQQVLSLDPRQPRRIPSHDLKAALAQHRALEIDWNGVAYRLVYRIYDKPAPKRVVVLSFAEHDPAYERAIARRSE